MGTAGIGGPSCGLSWSVLGKGVGGLFRGVGMDGLKGMFCGRLGYSVV